MVKQLFSIRGFQVKEVDGKKTYTGLIATTHPDRVGDILSKKSLTQMVDYINDQSHVGNQHGSYRAVSLYHDWVVDNDPTLDEAGFLLPNARLVELSDGHWGVEVDAVVNEYYKGNEKYEVNSPEEIKYRIENGSIGGFSIEYNTDNNHTKQVNVGGNSYRYIDELTDFAGVAFARSRLIANPYAVIYKEIETEVSKMSEENIVNIETQTENKEVPQEQVLETETTEIKTCDSDMEDEEMKKKKKMHEEEMMKKKELETKELLIKEVLESKEFKEKLEQIKPESKILKLTKEDIKMEQMPISIKEMKEALDRKDVMSFKEAAASYVNENSAFAAQFKTTGIPLNTTVKVKCDGTKIKMVGGLQVKGTLDSGSNTTSYTQAAIEFADVYVPGLIETFNQATGYFGAIPKVDHIMGGTTYGWRMTTSQETSVFVDPDDSSVIKQFSNKDKYQTPIKEARMGVSVSDYTLWHARAAIGDLFMIETEKAMKDLIKAVNRALFAEVADGTGTAILGLEAVADSAGNTTLYGKTRSTTNRLAPDAAADTYVAVGGALTTAKMRTALSKLESAGSRRENIRIIASPTTRDMIFELLDGQQRFANNPQFGFTGQITFDGVPVIVDSDCNSDAIYFVDFEVDKLVISRGPELVGLAKIGAAEEAYVTMYLAHVYEQPRKIHMLDTLS